MMSSQHKTDPRLLELLERTRNHVMTPEEVFEQRVSFVYGQQDHDKPGRSKDEIRQQLVKLYGYPRCPNCAASGMETRQGRDPEEGLGAEHDSPTAESGDAQ